MGFFSELFVGRQKSFNQQLNEEISKEIFDSSPEAILVLDNVARIVSCNKQTLKLCGFAEKEIVGRKIYSLPIFDKKTSKTVSEKFKLRLRGGLNAPYEISLTNKNGVVVPVSIQGSLVRDIQGKASSLIITVSDLSDQKNDLEVEQKIMDDLEKLSQSAITFSEFPLDGEIYQLVGNIVRGLVGESRIFVGRFEDKKGAMSYSHAIGFKANELIAANKIKLWLAKELKTVKPGVTKVKKSASLSALLRLLQKDLLLGEVCVLGLSWKGRAYGNVLIISPHGNPLRLESLLAFAHQASVALQKFHYERELKKYREGLERLVQIRTADLFATAQDLEKFRLAVKDASDHIIITDPSGKLVFANKGAEIMTGYSFTEMENKTPALWGKQMDDVFYRNFWKALNSKKPFLGEILNKRKNGQQYYAELHVSPVLGPDNEILFFVGIERDITKAKEVDQAKTEFVSLASHQLRTPLSAINWYTEMLMDGDAGKINKDQESYLKEIYNGSQRMVDLVNSLLNVSRLELGTFIVEPQKGSLKSISEDVFKELEPTITKKKQHVSKSYDSKVPELMLDLKLTRIIFQNLLSNAVKYTPDEGKVGVTIEINPDNKKEVKISVSDTGYGIPEYQQDKIFTKLFRADNVKKMEAEGTGLGVYIIKQIVDNAGGKIWFKSKENKGSTFYVTIPLSGMKKREGSKALS